MSPTLNAWVTFLISLIFQFFNSSIFQILSEFESVPQTDDMAVALVVFIIV